MIRKLTAVVAATLVAFALLPAVAASASATGSAQLTQGVDILPGTNAFKVSVTNGELPLAGRSVNLIVVSLPNTAGFRAVAGAHPAQGDWAVRGVSTSSVQQYIFEGGSLAPRSSVELSFPGTVAAPSAGDVVGRFRVGLSSDGGTTVAEATDSGLSSTVRVLGVQAITRTAPAAEAGREARGTALQSNLVFAVDVVNYSRSAVAAQPTLASTNATGTTCASSNCSDSFAITSTSPSGVAAGNASGVVTRFLFNGTLGDHARTGTGSSARDADRSATFTADINTSNADGRAATLPFTVDVDPTLSLTRSTFSPQAVVPNTARSFTVRATLAGTPSLSVSACTLTIAGTSVSASLANGPLSFAPGASLDLNFQQVQLTGLADGTYGVNIACSGVDQNGAAYAQTLSLSNILTIDGIAPIIQLVGPGLPTDADGRQQERAKNGDTITVSGSVDSDGAVLNTLELVLVEGTGTTRRIAATPTYTEGANNDGRTSFSASLSVTDFGAATEFYWVASDSDAAGNTGNAETARKLVDNFVPLFSYAETVTLNRIYVEFDEPGGPLYGACSESQWAVTEQLFIADVLYSDGTPCVAGQAGPDSARILVLPSNMPDQDSRPTVTYTPGTRPVADRAIDDAGHDAIARAIQTVIGTIPNPPNIIEGFRGTGSGAPSCTAQTCEHAYREGSLTNADFFTRFAGSDFVLQFEGARAGYTAIVQRAGGATTTYAVSSSPAQIRIPLPATAGDGRYAYTVQLENTNGRKSEVVSFAINLDRVAPTMASAQRTGASEVTVAFNELLPVDQGANANTDKALNWYGAETNTNQDPAIADDEYFIYEASSVASGATTASRVVTLRRPFEQAPELFAGALYEPNSGALYTDRAGNQLANRWAPRA